MLDEELNAGEEIRITNNKITSIEVTASITGGLPISYELYQNYPNPFNPSTIIKYSVQELSFVTIKIYDVLGNEITTIINREIPAGNYEAEFDAAGLSSGVYFYKIISGKFSDTKKMLLLK